MSARHGDKHPKMKGNKYALGNDGGRPIEYPYTQDMIVLAEAYLAKCQDTKSQVRLPSVTGLALYLKVPRSVIYEWKTAHKEFSTIVETILDTQEQRLLDNGLGGKYHAGMAKFILSAKHEYREKSDMTTDGKALPTPLLNAVFSNNSNPQSDGDAKED